MDVFGLVFNAVLLWLLTLIILVFSKFMYAYMVSSTTLFKISPLLKIKDIVVCIQDLIKGYNDEIVTLSDGGKYMTYSAGI